MVQNEMPSLSMNMLEVAAVTQVVNMLRQNIEAQVRMGLLPQALTAEDGYALWTQEFGHVMRGLFHNGQGSFLEKFWPAIQDYINTLYHL